MWCTFSIIYSNQIHSTKRIIKVWPNRSTSSFSIRKNRKSLQIRILLTIFWTIEFRAYSGGNGPRNISTNAVLNDCSALKLNGSATKLLWPGYDNNCNGTAPIEISTSNLNDNYFIYRKIIFFLM